ncbi:ATP-binding protein [Brachyspira innocens]|uniref:ATP-binding protein n=1 Tax=Brachyspira innocens TaxID=13264 RepID=A0ABT8YUA0_9SPIR|nr:ATP-binding protein [Brachyspira innocens]MDO6993457.1 ATP-binding protein [Brachyspira innocens]MDO7019314.1 ATP-binding protein [Brachyspira innocens]
MSDIITQNKTEMLDNRNQTELIEALAKVDTVVMKKYLPNLTALNVVPLDNNISRKEAGEYLRFYKINSIVFENKENNQVKLSSVFHSIYNTNSSVITIIESDGEKTDFYIGVKSFEKTLSSSSKVLERSIKGNFFGSDIENLDNTRIKELTDKYYGDNKIISSCSSIAGVKKSDYEDGKNDFAQGIEKLIDAMKGEKYSVIIISDPVSPNEISIIRNGYESIYSQLSPFRTTQLSFSSNESDAVTKTLTEGISHSVSESVSHTETKSRTTTFSAGTSIGGNVGAFISAGVSVGIGAFVTASTFLSGGLSAGLFGALNFGLAQSFGKSKSDTTGHSDTDTTSSYTSEGTTKTIGSGKTLQITSENKMITNILAEIDKQLERLNECEDVGVWKSSAYFITGNAQTNRVVSSMYQSLVRGEGSSVETGAINLWNNDNTNKKEVLNYVAKMHHPLFKLTDDLPLISPAVTVSSLEMAIQAGLPQKSVAGVPVIKYTPFAREIVSYDNIDNSNSINLGKVFHLGEEENTEVNLNVKSLASHTFITGSTGAGKSNAVYKIIEGFYAKNVKFLVIEPAKGEYKNVFGHRNDVHVFGTNPYYTELLRINPFSFHESIHVLEHIDRLIDIFNVCWPMYAAMPAVLKEAVEKSYIDTGWDLDTSVNKYGNNIFPNFIDVLNNLKNVIDSSDYSQEVKSNYTGSLVTRVKSLTNGIIGRIFSSKEIENEILFDENAIVDLSRIGSLETKSIIMGILIMKLSEYRTSSQKMNQELKHVTILEEAHNILKRTSTEQVSESANLVGKSVEMLSNSIAEMRTYGEGFIISDQSPSAVDMSAIRNTNTKIILRLPEYSDREAVGKAAGLDEDKIDELSRLHTGVAAVYQNNWTDSVLCKVGYYNVIEDGKSYKREDKNFIENKSTKGNILKCLVQKSFNENIDKNIIDSLDDINIAESAKINIREILSNENTDKSKLSLAVYDILNGADLLASNKVYTDFEIWHNNIFRDITNMNNELDSKYALEAMNLMLIHASFIGFFRIDAYNNWVEKFHKGGIL